jgi:hypothetical protein
MSATLQEQTFTATPTGDEFPMGEHEETVDLLPLLEAMQHEVLMRNMPGFVS